MKSQNILKYFLKIGKKFSFKFAKNKQEFYDIFLDERNKILLE